MATLIGSQAASGIQPRSIHAGVNSVYAVYSLTATLSAGDIIQMCKLPDNARIVNFTLQTNPALGTAAKLNLGYRGDHDFLVASATCAAAQIITPASGFAVVGGVGTILDVSGTATTVTPYNMIEVKVSDAAGATNTGSIAVTIDYVVDQR